MQESGAEVNYRSWSYWTAEQLQEVEWPPTAPTTYVLSFQAKDEEIWNKNRKGCQSQPARPHQWKEIQSYHSMLKSTSKMMLAEPAWPVMCFQYLSFLFQIFSSSVFLWCPRYLYYLILLLHQDVHFKVSDCISLSFARKRRQSK